jgi:hypothetical protein
MIGSYIKIFLSAIIIYYIDQGSDLFTFDLQMGKKLLSVGIGSLLPVLYNALNPHDNRYGKKPKPEPFKPLL